MVGTNIACKNDIRFKIGFNDKEVPKVQLSFLLMLLVNPLYFHPTSYGLTTSLRMFSNVKIGRVQCGWGVSRLHEPLEGTYAVLNIYTLLEYPLLVKYFYWSSEATDTCKMLLLNQIFKISNLVSFVTCLYPSSMKQNTHWQKRIKKQLRNPH